MIEIVKQKIWEMLKKKEVSLVIIFARNGTILWHKGREIHGNTIDTGHGFSKSLIKKAIGAGCFIEEKHVVIFNPKDELSKSAINLNIKSIYIQPLTERYFLYIDSGTKEYFDEKDRERFKIIAEFLSETILQIQESENVPNGLAGNSAVVKQIKELIIQYAIEEQPILILGETGVGKGHVAEMIHQYSGRKGKFVIVNTPSIAEHLLESEIFGHKKGAFTDASCEKKGLVHEANGGTLFLDEIADVPVQFQSKLLRFVETKKFRILGDAQEYEANVRIIAATNQDINLAVQQKQLRYDLYYRLQIFQIEIPPLRQRKEDIKALILEKKSYLKGKEIGKGFWEAMQKYNWPGNVRELFAVLIRAGIQCSSPITGEAIRNIIAQTKVSSSSASFLNHAHKTDMIFSEIKAGKTFWESVKKPFLNRDLNRGEVREIIQQGLQEVGGRYVDAIKVFNIDKKDYHKFMCFLNDNQLQ